MTSESEHANPNTNHIEEFHRSPCENNPTTSTDQSDSDSNEDEPQKTTTTTITQTTRARNSPKRSPKISKSRSDTERRVNSHVVKRKTTPKRIDRISPVPGDCRKVSSQDHGFTRTSFNKKLSYDEEDDDDDEKPSSLSNSPSPTTPETTTAKSNLTNNVESIKAHEVEKNGNDDEDTAQNNGFPKKLQNDSPQQTKKTTTDIKLADSVESDHDDIDASSTSSCSCEDHSSVNGETSRKETETRAAASNRSVEDEIHINDLDYNEDSMSDDSSDSPPEYNRLASERRMATIENNSNNNSLNQKDEPRNSSKSTVGDSRKSQQNNHKHNKRKESNHHHETDASSHKKTTTTRIKSFVNKNHHADEEELDDQMEQEDEFSSGNDSREKILSSLIESKSKKSIDFLMKYFFKDACYFQVKSINHENVELSKSMGVWSTSIQNELRFNTAFREHRNVILIFSVQQSGAFQGFARMVSESKQPSRPIPWILPERLSNKSLGGVFKVEWLCTKELAFHETHDLYNPFNGNKPVKVARDGQQVVSKIGKKLCKLFSHDDEQDKTKLLNSIATLKYQTSQRKKSNHKQDNFYPLLDARSATGNGSNHNGRLDDRYGRNGRQQLPAPYMHQHPMAAGLNGFIPPGVYPNPHHLAAHHQHEYMSSYNPYGNHMNFVDDQTAAGYYHPVNVRGRPIHNNNNPYYNRLGLYMPPNSPHKHSGNPEDDYYHPHHHSHPANNPHQHNLPLAYDNSAATSALSKSSGSEGNPRYHPYHRKNRR